MNLKTAVTLSAAVVIAAVAIPIAWRFPQFRDESHRENQLLQTNVKLQKRLTQIKTDLKAYGADDAKFPSSARNAWDDDTTIPVKIDLIKKIPLMPLEGESGFNQLNKPLPTELKLSTQAIGLLAMSKEEAAEVQIIYTGVEGRITNHARAGARSISSEQTAQFHLFEFMDHSKNMTNWGPRGTQDDELERWGAAPSNPGIKTAYDIPAMSEEDHTAMQKWLSDSLTATLGPERAKILTASMTRAYEFWPYPDQHRLVAFIDQVDPQTGDTRIEWTVVDCYDDNNTTMRSGGTTTDFVPPNLAYLFQPVTGEPNVRREIIH